MNPKGSCKYFRYSDILNKKNRLNRMGTWIIVLLFLCLMSMDFKSRFFYLSFALFALLLIIQRMEFEVSYAVLPALILSICMCLFSPSTRGWAMAMVRPFTYPLCVIVGYNLVNDEDKRINEQRFIGIMIALAAGAYFHYILNMINNWGQRVDRNTIDIWTQSVLAATGQSSLSCLMIGVAVSLLFSQISIKYKMLLTGVLISIMYYNLMLGGRTVFVVILVLLLLNLIFEWVKNKEGDKRIKILLGIIFFVMLVILMIRLNLFGLNNVFYSSNFFQRFFTGEQGNEFTEDGRMKYKILFLQNMLSYPFGGNELHRAVGNHYAHDLLLDTYSDSSIFAFLSIGFMLVAFLRRTIKMSRFSDIDLKCKKMLVNLLIVFFIIFAMEPIFDGIPWMFASFCVIYGAVSKMTEEKEIKKGIRDFNANC